MKIRNSYIFGIIGFMVLLSLGFTLYFYQMERKALESGIDLELFTAATMAREVLPENYHDKIIGINSVSDGDYLQVVDRFNEICRETGMEYLWSLMILDGKTVFTSSTSPSKDASKGDQAGFLEAHSNPELYTKAFETMQPQYQINIDKWGRIRAVLVPYLDSEGRKYLIGASRSMQNIDSQLQKLKNAYLILVAIIFLVSGSLSYILFHSLFRPISALKGEFAKIVNGDFNSRSNFSATPGTTIEVESLAMSYGLMKKAIIDRETSIFNSEEKYRLLTEKTKDVVWVLDSETLVFQFISSSIKKMCGYTPEELISQPVSFVLFPSESEYFINLLRSRAKDFLAGKEPPEKYYTNEVEHPRKDGTSVWTEAITSYYFNPKNGRGEIHGVSRDISERKLAEKVVLHQREQLNLLDKVSHRLNSTLDLQEIYNETCKFMSSIVPNDGLIISSYNDQIEQITCRAYWMENQWLDVSEFPSIPLEEEGKGTQSIVIRTGQSMLLNDFQAQQKTAQTIYYVNEETNEITSEISSDEELTRSALIVPLKVGGKITGVIQVMSYSQNAFTEDHLKLLEALSLHIASAEQNALLFDQAQKELAERTLTEKALRESEEKYRTVADYTYDWEAWLSPDGSYQYVSPSCERITGYTSYEFLVDPNLLIKITHPEDQSKITDHRLMVDHEEEEKNVQIDFRIINQNGETRWISHWCNAVYGEGGKWLGRRESNRDITERKETELKIQNDQIELRKLLSEAERSRLALLNVVEDQKEAESQILQLNNNLEEKVVARTKQLEYANKELEAFSYSVSHDLRAPLRGIDGFSLALKEDYIDKLDDQAIQYIDHVRNETQHMNQLIDDLLKLSHVTSSVIELETINLSDMAQKIVTRLVQDNPNQKAVFEIQPGVITVGDPTLLEVVLTNLLGNAYKYSRKASSPIIQFGQDIINGEPVFFVRDNGVGFNMDYAHKLFGAFQRMHKQTEFEGTGIGLATVKRIINKHNGRIWAEAKVNEGATFFFSLPE